MGELPTLMSLGHMQSQKEKNGRMNPPFYDAENRLSPHNAGLTLHHKRQVGIDGQFRPEGKESVLPDDGAEKSV